MEFIIGSTYSTLFCLNAFRQTNKFPYVQTTLAELNLDEAIAIVEKAKRSCDCFGYPGLAELIEMPTAGFTHNDFVILPVRLEREFPETELNGHYRDRYALVCDSEDRYRLVAYS